MEGLRFGLILFFLGAVASAVCLRCYILRPRFGQYIRPEGLATHRRKAGTPTAGGLLLLQVFLAAWATVAFWPVKLSWRGWIVFLSAVGAGGIGLLDDLLSQRRRRSEGLSPSAKLLLGLPIALGIFLMLLFAGGDLAVYVPFFSLEVGLRAIPAPLLFLLVLLGFWGTTNGANLTDGLDGLAAGCGVSILLGSLALAFRYPELVALALFGAGLFMGFLWWNAYPARVFMGDVGSMFLGGLIFGIFTASGGILFLPLFAGIFVVEALSVIAQVLSFKLFGVRVLKMSPLHHHLEEGEVGWRYLLRSPNWPEPVVVSRLWLLSAAFVALGILVAMGGW
ncbi:phospho-N-acetylmuramoyl-pentapeptide-transferase [Candidatus Bipolaricaulota bacterium]|nr:phospho-N-acetylmuramoyl-pentapeptide-transferase [Candidatus Bipolaricaulota bacterium]